MCKKSELNKLFEINAGEIVKMSSDDTYKKYFKDRYKLFYQHERSKSTGKKEKSL